MKAKFGENFVALNRSEYSDENKMKIKNENSDSSEDNNMAPNREKLLNKTP